MTATRGIVLMSVVITWTLPADRTPRRFTASRTAITARAVNTMPTPEPAHGTTKPIAPLTASARQLDVCATSAERLLEVTDSPRAAPDPVSPRPMPEPDALVLDGVAVELGGVAVLRDVSLALARGRSIGLLGASGAGEPVLAVAAGAGLLVVAVTTAVLVARRGTRPADA